MKITRQALIRFLQEGLKLQRLILAELFFEHQERTTRNKNQKQILFNRTFESF